MPNGWGQQKLYDVKIEYQENGVTPSVILEEKIGFRTVELVEDDLQSIHTFRFIVADNSFAYVTHSRQDVLFPREWRARLSQRIQLDPISRSTRVDNGPISA
jgi:hypothetical protein